MISLQMATFSWSLELITGVVTLGIYFSSSHDEYQKAVYISLTMLVVCIHFIVIPASYILNTEAYKPFIIAQGWFEYFTNQWPFNKVGGVAPNENIEMGQVPNQDQPIALLAPIPTISGNIRALNKSTCPNQYANDLETLPKVFSRRILEPENMFVEDLESDLEN